MQLLTSIQAIFNENIYKLYINIYNINIYIYIYIYVYYNYGYASVQKL